MDFQLTEEQKMFQTTIRDFAKRGTEFIFKSPESDKTFNKKVTLARSREPRGV